MGIRPWARISWTKRCTYAASILPGAPAWCVCSCSGTMPASRFLRSALCNVGSGMQDSLPHPAVADPLPIRIGPNTHMRFGRWTLPREYACKMALWSLGYASWMNAAARSWRPRFSPLASWSAVSVTEVRTVLRRTFTRWGRPLRFRVDNGVPWGSSGDLPPDLALWLLGIEVAVTPNPPRRPQDNGVVERSQGTGKRWAEPAACATAQQLQKRLREMDFIQREEYPSLAGRSRLAAYPELKHSGRTYTRAWEHKNWRFDLVLAHLAEYAVPRKVDKSGTVSLYNTNHYVGKLHVGKSVYVMLDPQRCEWIFTSEKGHQLRTQPAEQICRERIQKLTVTNRR